MSNTAQKESIERICELIGYIPHVVIATVNEDGTPHNTPVFGTFDDKLHFFWSSSPESQHSKNILRDGHVFIILFDSQGGNGGLYMSGTAAQLDSETHLTYGYDLLCAAKKRLGAPMGAKETYHVDDGPQRLYRAEPVKLWTSHSQKDATGAIIFDERIEINSQDLLSLL